MCIAIALAGNEVPTEMVGRHGLHRWAHRRGGADEFRFSYRDRVPRLPVWRDGNLLLAR